MNNLKVQELFEKIKDNVNLIKDFKLSLYFNKVAKLNLDGTSYTPHFALLPIQIDKNEYEKAHSIIPSYNLMVDSISRNPNFIYSALEAHSDDELISGLLNISKKVNTKDNQNYQSIHLNLLRHDFMMCSKEKIFKLVEWNTIACCIITFCDGVNKLYRNAFSKYPEIYSDYNLENLLQSDILEKHWSTSMVTAYNMYKLQDQSRSSIDYRILIVVSEGETNLFDIFNIQESLFSKGIKSIRSTFRELYYSSKVVNGELIVDGFPIALTYFRDGYQIEQYTDIIIDGRIVGWEVKERIELSNCVKSPDIDSLLSTYKKFQAEVTDPNVLNKLLLDKVNEKDVTLMLNSFSEIFPFKSLNKTDKEFWLNKLRDEYESYVIKPLKEGGNNNFNYEKVKQIAEEKNFKILEESMINKRIFPSTSKNIILKGTTMLLEDVITEIGFFSVIISDREKIITNEVSFPLFRTKQEKTAEGGISIGASYVNSGYLS